jgi:hypothetical protein
MEGTRNVCNIFVRKPKGKKPYRRPSCRWEDNIRMDLGEIGWESGLDAFGSGEGPVAGPCEHGNEPLSSTKGWNFLTR